MSIAERLQAELAQRKFADGFARSRKGNLWRHWDNLTLTVFERDEGGFAWCIVNDEGDTQYSKLVYEDEAEAIAGLEWALEIEE